VNEQWKTCSASRVVISVEKCMSDDAIQTCESWLGSIDPEWPEYTDCVADMQYLAKEMLTGKYVDEGYCCSTPGPADEDCWVEEEGKLHTC
jgi:hypothetical protein